MPTYQYACTSCGEQLEVVQKFTDEPLTECPQCQGRLRKVFSAVGVVFKGSGFYKTDSRSSKSASSPAAKEPSTDAGKDSSKDSSKPASTSAAKADSGSAAATSSTKDSAAPTSGGAKSGDSSKVA